MRLLVLTAFLTVCLLAETNSQQTDQPDTTRIPQQVMDGLMAKFPQALIEKWTREKEGEIVVYDFEFRQGEKRFEADVREDGIIHNWERAIPIKDLPEAVREAIDKAYPKGRVKEVMEVTAVEDSEDRLEGYEVLLILPGKQDVELMIAPDGRILEDSGNKE